MSITPWLRRKLFSLLRSRGRDSREFDLSSAADPLDPDTLPTPVVGPPPQLEPSAEPTRPGSHRASSKPPRPWGRR